MDIPIVVVCYNNFKYVKNILSQILRINADNYKNIIILNNKSSCLNTIDYLSNVDVRVINNIENSGPWITDTNNKHIYDILPNKFILTDPDLKLNEHTPSNFIEILADLSDKYKTAKIGLCLDISDHEKFYITSDYYFNRSIYEWEKVFWNDKIDDEYELYNAAIDTTFCLINKDNISKGLNIRVGGNFTSKHIPWYRENEVYNVYENYINNINTTSISSIAKSITAHIEANYLRIYKNNELFLISNNVNQNLFFWKDLHNGWEKYPFEVFDKYLSKDKTFIDIGGWISTSMYGSRKSKHIYTIEADTSTFNDIENNLKSNCTNNYTLINKAIYNIDNVNVNFGKRINCTNFNMNDLCVISDKLVETITLETIIKTYDINVSNISLIKVDIEGGEEHILNDLYDIHIKFGVPLYVKFHYNCWNDKNLDRFLYLSDHIKNRIISSPFCYILF